MKSVITIVIFVVMSSNISGCAHSQSNLKVTSKTPVKVYGAAPGKDNEVYTVNANEPTVLKHPVSRIEAEGFQPVVLALADQDVIDRSQETPVEIKLKPVEEWKGATTENFITKQMDTLYMELLHVLQLARSKQVGEALNKVDAMIKDYPKLASAYYVKAQVEILNGNQSKATETLNAALALKPEFKEAISLKDQLQKRGKR